MSAPLLPVSFVSAYVMVPGSVHLHELTGECDQLEKETKAGLKTLVPFQNIKKLDAASAECAAKVFASCSVPEM